MSAGDQPAPVLACQGVGKRFGTTWVLRDVSLELRPGEILGLVGRGGQGKSVLLKLLAGLIRPDEGTVLVEGRDLSRLNPVELHEVRERYGYLFQNYALFDFMTVRDNVAFPLLQKGMAAAEAEPRVQGILSEVGLGHALDLYPDELSGGMKKRVGLARAVIADPAILLYDDPTAGLDPVTSSKIFRLVEQMRQKFPNSAAVVVSHDVDRMKAVCSRWILIEEGEVMFRGTIAHVAAAPELVRTFFQDAMTQSSDAVAG